MKKNKNESTITLNLSSIEYEHLKTTMEGCSEELEELMKDVSWYTTELTDRLATCLEILEGSKAVK